MGLDAMILVFWMLSFKPTFSLSSNYRVEEVKEKVSLNWPSGWNFKLNEQITSWKGSAHSKEQQASPFFVSHRGKNKYLQWLIVQIPCSYNNLKVLCMPAQPHGPCPMLLVPTHKLSLHASALPPQGLGICCPEIKNTCLLALCRWGS